MALKKLQNVDPRLIEFWHKAATTRNLKVPCATEKEATTYRVQLHTVRRLLEREKHPYYEGASRVALQIKQDPESKEHPWYILCSQRYSDLGKQLEKAGVTVGDAPLPDFIEPQELPDDFNEKPEPITTMPPLPDSFKD